MLFVEIAAADGIARSPIEIHDDLSSSYMLLSSELHTCHCSQIRQSFFNLTPDSLKILLLQHLRVITRQELLLYARKRALWMTQADIRDVFGKP